MTSSDSKGSLWFPSPAQGGWGEGGVFTAGPPRGAVGFTGPFPSLQRPSLAHVVEWIDFETLALLFGMVIAAPPPGRALCSLLLLLTLHCAGARLPGSERSVETRSCRSS